MFQGIFKSAINDTNTNYIFGTGSIPIQIKVANLETFAKAENKQQGYQVAEVNKLISTMLTGWDANGNKPKSMSDNYLELILSCDNGFVVKKRLQFPHIIAWQDDSTPYNIADVCEEFSIDNWLKADDFENPDITLVVEPTDEILTTSTANPPEVTTTNSGRFYLYYRNLPVGINRIHIDFHIKTKTEPIDFDLEVADGLSWKDAQIILKSNEYARINVLLNSVKDVYKFTGAEGNFEDITMYKWNELYQQIISLKPNNKFTHDLFFILYESEIEAKITELEEKIGLGATIIYALPAIYAVVPSRDIGADGDYALFLFTNTLNRIYKKANGVWEKFEDYNRVLVCAGNRVFYRKNNDETILFTEITTPIIDFEILNEGIPSQPANEGDYTLSLNVDGSTNVKRLYIYNNAAWKEAYSCSHFISPIFSNGNNYYKIYVDQDNTISNVTKIINNSVVDILQKEIGDLQKETSIENLAATASGTIAGTGASDTNFYLNVTPLTTYTLRFKAQYTGALGLYASTDGNDSIGLLFEVKDTDFTSEYVATITTPENCNVIRTRTWLAGAVIDYISLYSVLPLNVVVKDIEEDVKDIREKQKAIQLDWLGKVISTYGDSVTALNGGDFYYPYDESTFGYKWALRVANYFNASSVKNRGIGGQRFSWLNNGGSISWVNTLTGEYVNRNDSYNYDNYEGNVEIPSGCTPIRGALSSWLRITSMYPESIKDTIDVILVMAHNDAGLDTTTKLQFLTGDNTDPEWANSAYYQTYNGDYNINTVRGGIASTIMKLQAWMPNAVIVLMTPISGKGTQGELNPELASIMTEIADIVKEMHNLMSIPCIDVYGTCGINGLNRTLYITDTIHPYSENGSKMVARAVIGGLKSILPNM